MVIGGNIMALTPKPNRNLMGSEDSKKAAILVIGDEILSGRTQDTNTNHIARFLGALGIDLKEVRVVGDVEGEIVAALNALRAAYDFVFTTGGIGPTHDDITADAVARAFGVGIGYHPEVYALLEARYPPGEFNDMRKRMARIPHGASLVANPVSAAPGFHIGNVYVLAGVPMVMRAMLEQVAPDLPRGTRVSSVTLEANVPEGTVAPGLAQLQKAHPDVAMGSYPFYREGTPQPFGAQLVLRSRDGAALERAAQALEAMLRDLGAAPQRINPADTPNQK
jgi:molybdenum cofactor synthesis domain-containing protein